MSAEQRQAPARSGAVANGPRVLEVRIRVVRSDFELEVDQSLPLEGVTALPGRAERTHESSR